VSKDVVDSGQITKNKVIVKQDSAENITESENTSQFEVKISNFEGPFDVLLGLISKHKLDITRIALSEITDEFIEFVKQIKDDADFLDEISQFILIAATLLDIKAARLLPGQENFNEEDLELLQARDLLFAKLLQYKAYKDVALEFQAKFDRGAGRYPRQAQMEEQFRKLLPELNFDVDTRQLVLLAAGALTAQSYRNEGVSLDHIHMRQVNVAQQGIIISKRLMKSKSLKFSELIKDAKHAVIVIGRFLSLLELYKMNAVEFVQEKALGTLVVNWVAPADFNPDERLQGSDFDTPVTDESNGERSNKVEVKDTKLANNRAATNLNKNEKKEAK
jgi:segregation and condensation protein A